MELAIPFGQYADDLFERRERLWLPRSDFVRYGLHGLHIPQSFANAERLKELAYNALHTNYWNNIGRMMRPELPEINVNLQQFIYGNGEAQTPHTDPVNSQKIHNLPPRNRGGPPRWLLPAVALLGLGVVAIGLGVYFYSASREESVAQLTSQTTYVAKSGERVSKISRKFGIPAAIIKTDNNLQSDYIVQPTELIINPVTGFRKIPHELGEQLFAKFTPTLHDVSADAFNISRTIITRMPSVQPSKEDYLGAYVLDVPSIGSPGSLETIVLFNKKSQSSKIDDEDLKPFEHKFDRITFIVLDAKDRKLHQEWFGFGEDPVVYPIGVNDYDYAYNFVIVSNYRRDGYPWLTRDLKAFKLISIEGKDRIRSVYLDERSRGVWLYSNVFSSSKGKTVKTVSSQLVGAVDFPVINHGRYLKVDYEGDTPLVTVVNWRADGNIHPEMREDANLALRSSEPFAIRRYKLSDGRIRDVTQNSDLKAQLVRLYSTEDLSQADLNAISITAAKNETGRLELFVFPNSKKIIEDSYVKKSFGLKDGSIKATSVPGVLDRRTLYESLAIAGKVVEERPELIVKSVKAVREGRDPTEDVATMLNVEQYLASVVFDSLPLVSRDETTGRLSPLKFSLWGIDGTFIGVPYKDHIYMAVGIDPSELGNFSVGYESQAGIARVYAEGRTTVKDASEGRLPTLVAGSEGMDILIGHEVEALVALQRGDQTKFIESAFRLGKGLGFIPDSEETVERAKGTERAVEIWRGGGNLRDLFSTSQGSNEQQRQQFTYIMGTLDTIARTGIQLPNVTVNVDSRTGEITVKTDSAQSPIQIPEIKPGDIDTLLKEGQKWGCVNLKVGC